MRQPLAIREPQVRVDDLDGAAVNVDINPESPPRFQVRSLGDTRQSAGAHQPHGMVTQHRVAILLLFETYGGVEVKLHLQLFGNIAYLVAPVGPAAANIALLQGDDVGVALRDHACNPPLR